ncbi:hypothetical protein TYRP_002239 [Tyrophagus putrescentiae]|nr:hypothetical protein TYRP_002239 [Tyrophagus putrescentiae]
MKQKIVVVHLGVLLLTGHRLHLGGSLQGAGRRRRRRGWLHRITYLLRTEGRGHGAAAAARLRAGGGVALRVRLRRQQHRRHAPVDQRLLSNAVLQPLVTELLLDVHAVRHRALRLLAVLRVVAAQGNELLADGTVRVALGVAAAHGAAPLAGLGVLHHALHLQAGHAPAVGVAALTGVVEVLDAPLNRQAARLAGRGRQTARSARLAALLALAAGHQRAGDGDALVAAHAAQTELAKVDPVHGVVVAVALVAADAEIKVITGGAVVARVDQLPLAVIARVEEAVVAAVVQLVEHRQAGELGPPQAREFVMLITGKGEEGITTVHEITINQGIRVADRRQTGGGLTRVKAHHEEHLLNSYL